MIRGLILIALLSANAHAFERVLLSKTGPQAKLAPSQSVLLVIGSRPGTMNCPGCGDLITIVHQPHFDIGSLGARFVVLTVAPTTPHVTDAPQSLFYELDAITAPKVVYDDHVVNDDSLPNCSKSSSGGSSGCESGTYSSGGCNAGSSSNPPPVYTPPQKLSQPPAVPEAAPDMAAPDMAAPPASPNQFTAIADLQAFLDADGYAYEQSDLDAVAAYLSMGWTAVAQPFVADHDFSGDALGAFALTYQSNEAQLPVAVARQPGSTKARVSVYVAADTSYEIGTTDEVTWANPSNEVVGSTFITRNEAQFPLDVGPESDPVATRGSGTAFTKTVTVPRTIHNPTGKCSEPNSGCGVAEGRPLVPPLWLLFTPIPILIGRRAWGLIARWR